MKELTSAKLGLLGPWSPLSSCSGIGISLGFSCKFSLAVGFYGTFLLTAIVLQSLKWIPDGKVRVGKTFALELLFDAATLLFHSENFGQFFTFWYCGSVPIGAEGRIKMV